MTKPLPRYQQIRENLRERIQAGEWAIDEAITPEETLTKEFAVARMTVNRAIRELVDAGLLYRTQGSGTYVAPLQVESSLITIRNIADEITERGHTHRSALVSLESRRASAEMAREFGLRANARLFHSLIVHHENDVPIQIEDRWVNPLVAPDYLAQDFSVLTPNAYLSAVAPLTRATYRVEACGAPLQIAQRLVLKADAACLLVVRTTHTRDAVASHATLWHPGSRYRLTGSV
jgi:GntR family transcriptional regulator, histidine utilization repressor